jgi:hypothetical protein
VNDKRRKPDWSRRLPRPLIIPKVMTLQTLGDVRELIERRLPASYRGKETWQIVAAKLGEAARGGEPPDDVSLSLRIVLNLEGVPADRSDSNIGARTSDLTPSRLQCDNGRGRTIAGRSYR